MDHLYKERIVEITLFIVGSFIAYQLLKKIFAGSWQSESLIIALLIFNLGITWRLNARFEGHIGWHKGKSN